MVIAGEIIEHLSNQGIFLENVKRHLKDDDGVLILTTPNSVALVRFLSVLILGSAPTNEDHMLWHNFLTLKQLLKRYHMKIIETYYITTKYSFVRWAIQKIVLPFRKDFCENLLVIAKKY